MLSVLPGYYKHEIGRIPALAEKKDMSLYLEVTPFHFSAAVAVEAFNQFQYLIDFSFSKRISEEKLPEVLSGITSSHPELNYSYGKIKIAFWCETELVPKGFEHYTGDTLLEPVKENIFAAYKIDDSLFEVARRSFANFSVTTVQTTFIRQALSIRSGVFVLTFQDCFGVALIPNEEQLVLNNWFSYKNPEDFLYFLLMACESLQIDRSAIPLFCCGRTDKSSP
ncbi:MAG: DUF3822 family protein, partial [Chitinophagales bacterium]|nr:DUF3822 family protein [Chitinophagales bacterium]